MVNAPNGCSSHQEDSEPVSILVIEDDVLARIVLSDDLRAEGYQVVEAANADDALAVLRSGTAVDLILSDIHMPGSMDGIEFARLAGAEYPAMKILLASSEPPSIEGTRHDGFFAKPYDVARIIAKIRSLFG
jgi:two-component system, response regulator PdtaR